MEQGPMDRHIMDIMSMVQCRFCRVGLVRDHELAQPDLDRATARDPMGSKLV
jgi:hypothetical protein